MPSCNCALIPERLRPTPTQVGVVDSNFLPDDFLYRRVEPNTYLDDLPSNRDPSIIDQIEDISCFWSRYCSDPLDSLYDDFHCQHLPDHQIVRYRVGTVETGFNVRKKDNALVSFSVAIRHDPTDCIYSHCEIKNYKSTLDYSDEGEDFEAPSSTTQEQSRGLFNKPEIKSAYRLFLANNFEILKRTSSLSP